ncbi:MAG: D-alanyl-D-alanine carboxypeptidase [Candidatus Buchananbacteria bacterium]|nr:D-alanyl-D-alanine carboxypeptidase [Candidatus Buchananbacteria bacterium]
MKKIIAVFAIIVSLGLPISTFAATKPVSKPIPKEYSVAELKGRVVLQSGTSRLWYIDPITAERVYLRDATAFNKLRSTAKIVTAAALKAIPTVATKTKNTSNAGLFIATSSSSSVWYVNPASGVRYQISDLPTLSRAVKVIGLEATATALQELPMRDAATQFDPLFGGIAYAKVANGELVTGSNSEQVLPLASLSKVMTALVLIDFNLDWDREVTVTAEQINYPRTQVGGDATSEVPLKAGDRVKISDLWVALMAASSNQSAVILADSTGLTRKEFAAKMNEKVAALGLTKTRYVEMSGLSVDNISTAREMAIIGGAAFADPRIADASRIVQYDFNVVDKAGNLRSVPVRNRNLSLFNLGATAAKTGYLVEARLNVALQKDGATIVVLHASTNAQRNQIISAASVR